MAVRPVAWPAAQGVGGACAGVTGGGSAGASLSRKLKEWAEPTRQQTPGSRVGPVAGPLGVGRGLGCTIPRQKQWEPRSPRPAGVDTGVAGTQRARLGESRGPGGGQAGPHLTRSCPPRLGEAETGGRGHLPEPGLDGGAGLVWRGDRHTRHPNKPSKPQTIQEPLPRAELGRVPAPEKGFLLCPLLTHRPLGLSHRRGGRWSLRGIRP